jgi:hypothetical protein
MIDDVSELESWDILWNEKYANNILMFNNSRDAFAISLFREGYYVNTTNEKELDAAARELESLPALRTKKPIGTLPPFSFLYGKGPAMTFYSIPSGGLTAEFSNTFTSAGINYTLHRIVLTLKVTVTVVMPGERIEKEVAADFFIAETVLSGSIPDIYISQENGG